MIRLQTFVLTLIFSKEHIIIDMGRGSVGGRGRALWGLELYPRSERLGSAKFFFFNMITFLPVIAPACLRQNISSLTSLF